jgi:ABC-type transporter Mla subunit MlaD
MNFIYKLFPYKSLFQLDGDTLTAWWVLATILVFIVYVRKILNLTNKLRTKLVLLNKNFSQDIIEEDLLFSPVWKEYKESFIDVNGTKKTHDFSYDYFNENNLLSANTNLSLINSIPATLVGIGILGTFVGLTFGISDFQTGSSETIQNSIQVLLSGMGTAFVSSIYGMLLSLVFTFLEKIHINSLHNSINSLCYNLDKRFKITKEDEKDIFFKKQEGLLNDYFAFRDDSGNLVKPGNIFRDIFIENRKQSVALQAFSTDLANLIEAGFDRILNDPDKQEHQRLLQQLKESSDLMKIAIETEIQKLGDKLQDPATDMIETMLNELKSSLGEMVREFNNSVSGSAKDEIENLTQLLGQAGGSLNDFPNKLDEMISRLNENFNGLQEIVKNISKETLEQSEKSNMKMKEQVELTANLLGEKIGDLQIGHESLLTKQNENLQVSESLLNSFNSSIDKQDKLVNQINETILGFSKVQGELNSASGQWKSITDNILSATNKFNESQSRFVQHSEDFLSQNASTIEQIQSSLKQAKDLSIEYSKKFEIIQNGLQGIFQQIHSGLEDYRGVVGQSLEGFLGEYTSALTNTAESLGGAASKYEAIVEELTEQLSNLQNNRLNNEKR